jgi:hypothetical protein
MQREKIFSVARDIGARKIRVSYSGGGDSGSIDGVELLDEDDEPISDDPTVSVAKKVGKLEADGWREIIKTQVVSLRAAVEEWCYDHLESRFGGWEINEGSQGEFVFRIPDDEIDHHHEENVMTTNNTDEVL